MFEYAQRTYCRLEIGYCFLASCSADLTSTAILLIPPLGFRNPIRKSYAKSPDGLATKSVKLLEKELGEEFGPATDDLVLGTRIIHANFDDLGLWLLVAQ